MTLFRSKKILKIRDFPGAIRSGDRSLKIYQKDLFYHRSPVFLLPGPLSDGLDHRIQAIDYARRIKGHQGQASWCARAVYGETSHAAQSQVVFGWNNIPDFLVCQTILGTF